MAGARRAAVDVAVFRRRTGGAAFVEARRASDVAASGGQSFENWVEALDGLFGAADHHAVSAFQSPDAAARAHIDIVNALGGAHFRAAYVVFKERISAVDDSVALLHAGEEGLNRFFGGVARWDHDPGSAGRSQFCNEVIERSGTGGAFAGQLFNRVRAEVGHDQLMAAAHKTARHVRAHAPEAYHCELH